MLTLSCSLRGRFRESGGQRYVLAALDAKSIMPGIEQPKGPDLDRTNITIHSYDAATATLANHGVDPKTRVSDSSGSTQMVLGMLGWLMIDIYLSEKSHLDLISDLDQTLSNGALLVFLDFTSQFDVSNKAAIEKWLAGDRYAEDLELWGGVPQTGLIFRSLSR